jgi:hypothetical protein
MTPAPAPPERLACNDCGAHSFAPTVPTNHALECPVCEGFDLVPVALAAIPRRPALPFAARLAAA